MFDQTDTTGVPTSDGPPAYQPGEASGSGQDFERFDASQPSDRSAEIISDEPTRKSTALGWVVTIAVAVILTVLVKSFILQAYSITSPDYAEHLEFLSIVAPDGQLTSHLKDIRPGDHVLVGS